MASVIKAGNATDGVQVTSDNTGILELKTGTGAGTTAMTIGTDQSVTFAATPTYSGGTANGVAYLNASKALTTGTGLVFDGANLGVGTSSPGQRLDVRAAAGGIYLSSTTGTNQVALQTNNSGGDFYFGIDNSAGNNFNTGTAYAGAIWRSGANPICFVNNSTERMRIDSAGNVGLGVTPSAWASGMKMLQFGNGTSIGSLAATYALFAQNYYYDGTNNIYLTTNRASLYAQDSGSHKWFNAPSGTAGTNVTLTQVMTLDTSGNLGLGTTSPLAIGAGYSSMDVRGSTGGGFYFGASGGVGNYSFCYASTSALDFGITANAALRFYTNNTQRGQFSAAGNFIPGADNTYTCGQSGTRWSAIWAANGTIQTSDARQKNTITDSDLGLEFISNLRPVSYKWNVGQNIVSKDEEGNDVITSRAGVRTHYGLIAQEVKEALGDKDFGGFIHDSETDEMGLRYDQFISPLIKAIQELKAELDATKAEVAALKGAAQ